MRLRGVSRQGDLGLEHLCRGRSARRTAITTAQLPRRPPARDSRRLGLHVDREPIFVI